MNNKRKFSGLTIVTCIILTFVITASIAVPTTLYFAGFDLPLLSSHYTFLEKLRTIDAYVRTNFLYKIDDDKLLNNVIDEYITSLGDDYATYYDPDELQDKTDYLEGNNVGMGTSVALNPDTNAVTIIYVNKKSPAFTAGLKANDIITAVNGTSISDKSFNDAMDLMKGKAGDILKLTVNRDGKSLDFSVTLGDYTSDCVMWSAIDSVGYIKITVFNDNTYSQFKQAIDDLTKKNVKGLVFDLRDNPGGTVDSCADILDMLLPSGKLINVKYKDGSTEATATSDASEIDLPMAVILNANSASSSEVFAMSLRDYEKAVLVGVTSFGKGIMQTTYTLSDKTAVKFTTAYIIDKNGKSYHGKGLTPDIEVKLTEDQQNRFYFLTPKEDPQLQAAINAVS